MSLVQESANCCNNNPDYAITFKNEPNKTHQVCNQCFEKSIPLKIDKSTTIETKVFQYKVFKIICNSCGSDVTKTRGCKSCHGKKEEGR